MDLTAVGPQSPIRFHQLRPGQTTKDVADKYNLSEEAILADNPEVKGNPGDIFVLKTG